MRYLQESHLRLRLPMTDAEKLQAIKRELQDMNLGDMTTAEFNIYCVLDGDAMRLRDLVAANSAAILERNSDDAETR